MKKAYVKPFLEITDVQSNAPVLVVSGWSGGGSACGIAYGFELMFGWGSSAGGTGGTAPGFDLEPGWDSGAGGTGGTGGFGPDFGTDPDW